MNKTLANAAAILGACCLAGLLSARLGVFSARPAPPDALAPAALPAAKRAVQRPFGIQKRIPWTSSHITGSPEPPHPYRIARVFPKLTFKNPLLIEHAPGSKRLFVGEHAGKIYSFPNDQKAAKADLFLDLTTELHSWDKAKVKGVGAVYGLAFHPQFARNRYCYICYVLDSKKEGEQLTDGSRVSRFRVTRTYPPRCDPRSEKVLITWLAGGHNGGCLQFGPDGYLYISTGDGADPNPPDRFDTGQDISDLLSSILRIDVERQEKGKPYAIPLDNPFIKIPKARPEVWAYGFRNPWRMSFDRVKGDLWVGDVGWELWEMIYRVQRGGNYGWSVMEGPQPVRPNSRHGPTPIRPPALAFPHTEAASITGGYVYHGKRLKDLVGAYICGDWMTRKVWGTRFDGDRVIWHKELAQGTQRIVAFGEDNDGELYFLNYDDVGTIHQLAPNDAHLAKGTLTSFPTKLSETGLFQSVTAHEPAPGVMPFSINAEQWADHATAQRLVALPGTTTVRIYDYPIAVPGTAFYTGRVFFPKDGVLAKTISLELERGNPRSRRRLETQILHFDGETWHGYTYAWNDQQTDAALVPAAGMNRIFTIKDAKVPAGQHTQTWHFHSRAECSQCHNPWAGYTLAFTGPQLNRDHPYGSVVDNQLRTLQHVGIVTRLANSEAKDKAAGQQLLDRLVAPYDSAGNLNARARSYLHVNCSHCHQFGAGGTADIDLRYEFPLEQTKTLEVRPVQGTFDIRDARILAPGDPYRSVLYYRMAKSGPGRMPHIGSEMADARGLRLIHDWIRRLPIRQSQRALIDQLRELGNPAQRAGVIHRLLSSTSSALMLAHAFDENQIPDNVRREVLKAVIALAEPQVRDLFERFLPDDQRVHRLGSVINPAQILALKGSPTRGKTLFFKSVGLQCINCHRVAGTGSDLGPDLTQIGKKYTRPQILESILEPSKTIDPKYATYVVETADGRVETGLLAVKNAREVVLRNVGNKEIHIPAHKVVSLMPQKISLMPEQLLRDLTAEQAADLLDFLFSLK